MREECVRDWVIKQEMINKRIACPEAGYPPSEACYDNVEEWEKATGQSWKEHLLSIERGEVS